MNKNMIIVLGGAILIAFAVAMIVQLSVGGDEDVQVVSEERAQILVASKDLGVGRELVSGDLRWQDWPKSSIFAGAVVRKEGEAATEAASGRLARGVAKGEPMMISALLSETRGNFVSASLEPGMRAMSINVSASGMVAGFIGPGDFVDVILTYRKSVKIKDDDARVQEMLEKSINKYATETIIQNVKILAVDQTAQRAGDDDEIKVGKTVTLAVAPRDAERLSLASQMGELMLALRGVGDDAVVKSSEPVVSDARLVNVEDEIFEEYKKIKDGSGYNSHNVRIYSGSKISDVKAK